MTDRQWTYAVLVAATLGLAGIEPRSAHAQAAASEGTVVTVEKDDLVLDVGSSRGLADGQTIEIWRPLRVRHPVTGKVIADRFLIGRLRLVQVRPNLSLARPEGELSRSAEVGDVVMLPKVVGPASAPTPSPASAPAPAPSPAAAGPATAPARSMDATPAPADDEAARLTAIFDSLRGADVPQRIRAYETYVYAHPHGRYVNVLWEEARALRKLLTAGEAHGVPPSAPAVAREDAKKAEGPSAETQAFDHVIAGQPLRIALTMRGEASGAVLYSRDSDRGYMPFPMARVGAENWAATIPGEAIRAPTLEWFVEAVGGEGTHPVVGNSTAPMSATVEDLSPAPARKALGQAAIWTDYASFSTNHGNDYTWQTEGVMGARFDDEGIRAVRTGFGVYRGVGGPVSTLDGTSGTPQNPSGTPPGPGTPVGLTYGFLETELGLVRFFSIAARAIVGLREDGVNGGGSGFLRIGSDLETNLLLGGEILGGIGLRGVTEFNWNTFRDWPIVLRAEVTNQPAGAGGDVGLRTIAQVGYRVLPHLVLAGRVSYQGRTINHAGPGAGAMVGYAW